MKKKIKQSPATAINIAKEEINKQPGFKKPCKKK